MEDLSCLQTGLWDAGVFQGQIINPEFASWFLVCFPLYLASIPAPYLKSMTLQWRLIYLLRTTENNVFVLSWYASIYLNELLTDRQNQFVKHIWSAWLNYRRSCFGAQVNWNEDRLLQPLAENLRVWKPLRNHTEFVWLFCFGNG